MLRFWLNQLDCIADLADNVAMLRCVSRLKLAFLGLRQPQPEWYQLITFDKEMTDD